MVVPPRSYPQGPPSNLPGLILGVLRLFSWIAGGSTVVVFIYYVRFSFYNRISLLTILSALSPSENRQNHSSARRDQVSPARPLEQTDEVRRNAQRDTERILRFTSKTRTLERAFSVFQVSDSHGCGGLDR